jgi:hypothetical protein
MDLDLLCLVLSGPTKLRGRCDLTQTRPITLATDGGDCPTVVQARLSTGQDRTTPTASKKNLAKKYSFSRKEKIFFSVSGAISVSHRVWSPARRRHGNVRLLASSLPSYQPDTTRTRLYLRSSDPHIPIHKAKGSDLAD